jgi:hypothetical protein
VAGVGGQVCWVVQSRQPASGVGAGVGVGLLRQGNMAAAQCGGGGACLDSVQDRPYGWGDPFVAFGEAITLRASL